MRRLFSTFFFALTLTASVQAQLYLGIQTYDKGYGIPIEDIDSMVYSSGRMDMLPELMKKDPAISLFTEALYLTGVNELLYWYYDPTYFVGGDSVNWDNVRLVKYVAPEYDNVAYPKQRRRAFTVFAEPDTVFANKYGVTDIDGLKHLAAQLYDPAYPADASVKDPTDPRNSLHRFMLYHILNRRATYFMLTCVDGHSELDYHFVRTIWDIADWYETMLPQASLKCSFPASGSQSGLYVNRRGVQSRADAQGVQVRGAKLTNPEKEWGVQNESDFGVYHYIDDVIAYDLATQQTLGGELWRVDATTLSPDFMTQTGYNGSHARGHNTIFGYYVGEHPDNYSPDIRNPRYSLGFKAGTAENFEFTDVETHLHVRPRTLQFWSYQGDEVALSGNFDVTVKLPPLPAGEYELMMGVCVGMQDRATVQVYLDGIAMGDPIDPSVTAASLGWNADDETELNANGWRKGPKEYWAENKTFSETSNTLRRILGRITYDGKTDHYLRLKSLASNKDHSFPFDYLDFVPVSLLSE